MEYVVLFGAILIFLMLKGIMDERKRKDMMKIRIKEAWGKRPEQKYSSEKVTSILQYYRSITDLDTDIDSITWNDLNMDEIYMLINNTSCSIGEEYLYAMLRKLLFDEKELKNRGRLIRFFGKEAEVREELQYSLHMFGKMEQVSLYEYINRTDDIEIDKPWLHYLYIVLFFVGIGTMYLNPAVGAMITIGVIANNMVRYNMTKAKIEGYFNVFAYILKMVDSIEAMDSKKFHGLEQEIKELKQCAKAFVAFKRGSSIVFGGRGVVGGFAELILDYVRMIFHVDIIKFNRMLTELRAHKNELNCMYEIIGLLDSCLAVASFREYIGDWSEPELVKCSGVRQKPFIQAKNVYHPLITNPVKNSIYQDQSVLITGSNASGKSTFLRTVAINAVLAQTIDTTLTDSYRASYFKIYSSMALTDSLANQESYYMAEIKSLKRILDQMDHGQPILCFIDEVLRGTNTVERISASAEILHSIAKHHVLCMAATHDIELTNILESSYTNYHFQEEVKGNDVLFDYKLYLGKARSKNAIKLLSIIGYDRAIIDAANRRANLFLETGEWSNF